MSVHLHAVAASFWREWHRELRRHAGDERLPFAVRVRLRTSADRALQRSAVEERRAIVPRWNRRAIAAAPPSRLSPQEEQRARQLAMERGVRLEGPFIVVETGVRPDRIADAAMMLSREGYRTVSLPGAGMDPLVERYALQMGAFVVCRGAALQHAAFEVHTPSLRLDARDPLTAYPIRPDGVFTLATAIDLDTGRTLATRELLSERYFRHARNCGYRETSRADVASAIAEMIEGVRRGWSDSEAQARFRRAAAAAGADLGGRVRHLVEWDAAEGFVGDGRLARAQAERAL